MTGRALLLILPALLVGACSDEREPSDDPASLFCQGLCRAASRCTTVSVACQSYCVASDPGLARLSTEGARELGACVARLGCDDLEDSAWEASFQGCWDEARLAVRPTQALRRFCTPYAEAWFECGAWYSVAECEDVFGMWSEEIRAEALGCTEQPTCNELVACEAAIFE